MRQHVQDEALLDRLLHGVAVEGVAPDRAVRPGLRVRLAEDFQRLVLRRRGEGEVARVGEQPARLHQPVDPVLEGLVFALRLLRLPLTLLFPLPLRVPVPVPLALALRLPFRRLPLPLRLRRAAGLGERLRHRRAGAPALAGVGLVDDDGEAPPALLVADLVEDEGELLHRRDNDLLAGLDEAAKVAGTLRVPHGRADLGVPPDRVADLPVEEEPIGDHDDGIEDRGAVLRESEPVLREPEPEPDQLVREPGDGVALAAARGVLDEVAPAGAVRGGVGEQPAHHVELVVARPDLASRLAAGSLVPGLHHLGVVLQDMGQALAGQHLAPQVVGLDPARVGRNCPRRRSSRG